MFKSIRAISKLTRAGWTLSRYHAFDFIPDERITTSARMALGVARLPGRLFPAPDYRDAGADKHSNDDQHAGNQREDNLRRALSNLGPSWIKLGQFLATRPDVVGHSLAQALSQLQDNEPSFSADIAWSIIKTEFGTEACSRIENFSSSLHAASIAQVHQATLHPRPNITVGAHKRAHEATPQKIAIKVLRPGISRRFLAEIDDLCTIALLVSSLVPSTRRLRLVDVSNNLRSQIEIELDLRLEAAALNEFASYDDDLIRIPRVADNLVGREALAMEWIDGTRITDRKQLIERGIDPARIAERLMRSFLHQALYHGAFHADMHGGNLLVDGSGTIVMLDFGIVGRLDTKTRTVMAKILYGFTVENYDEVAHVHIQAGYVPPDTDVSLFAQALRAVASPIHSRTASDFSMASLLAQLFETTERFNMETRPELVLLQKSMLMTEGLCRHLDREFNMWGTATPILSAWVRDNLETDLQDETRKFVASLRDVPAVIESIKQISSSMNRRNQQENSARFRQIQFQSLGFLLIIGAVIATCIFVAVKI